MKKLYVLLVMSLVVAIIFLFFLADRMKQATAEPIPEYTEYPAEYPEELPYIPADYPTEYPANEEEGKG